jgi:hypothetical protein
MNKYEREEQRRERAKERNIAGWDAIEACLVNGDLPGARHAAVYEFHLMSEAEALRRFPEPASTQTRLPARVAFDAMTVDGATHRAVAAARGFELPGEVHACNERAPKASVNALVEQVRQERAEQQRQRDAARAQELAAHSADARTLAPESFAANLRARGYEAPVGAVYQPPPPTRAPIPQHEEIENRRRRAEAKAQRSLNRKLQPDRDGRMRVSARDLTNEEWALRKRQLAAKGLDMGDAQGEPAVRHGSLEGLLPSPIVPGRR